MKKLLIFFLSMFGLSTGFAEHFVLNNQIANHTSIQQAKIAVQWANSAKDIEKSNNKIRQGIKLNENTLKVLTRQGATQLDIPKKAEYFRVLVWSKGAKDPDFLTNWVDIVPNKTYTLNEKHLIPLILMSGTGC